MINTTNQKDSSAASVPISLLREISTTPAPASEQQAANDCPHDGLKCAIDSYCDKCPLRSATPAATTASAHKGEKA